MESESVGFSDEEVAFSLLCFPVVNIKPVVLRSHRYPVASRYLSTHEEVELQNDNNMRMSKQQQKTTTITTFFTGMIIEFVVGIDSIDNIELTSDMPRRHCSWLPTSMERP
jgi:hypothetical protein